MSNETMTIEDLKAVAKSIIKEKEKAKKEKGKKIGIHKKMTEDQLNMIRKLRMSGYTHTLIFETMKKAGMMPYTSYCAYQQAYIKR